MSVRWIPRCASQSRGLPEMRHGFGTCIPVRSFVKTEYVCPMHPEIVRSEPGSCPICGMALEPRTVTLEEEVNPELVDMTRRFWISLVLNRADRFSRDVRHDSRTAAATYCVSSIPQLAPAWVGDSGGSLVRMAILSKGLGFDH